MERFLDPLRYLRRIKEVNIQVELSGIFLEVSNFEAIVCDLYVIAKKLAAEGFDPKNICFKL